MAPECPVSAAAVRAGLKAAQINNIRTNDVITEPQSQQISSPSSRTSMPSSTSQPQPRLSLPLPGLVAPVSLNDNDNKMRSMLLLLLVVVKTLVDDHACSADEFTNSDFSE